MNILIFTASFHPYIGGLENHTLSLMYEFIRQGNEVKVIAIQFQSNTPTSATPILKGVKVYYRPGFFQSLKLYLWCSVMFMPNMSLRGMWLLPFNPFKKLVISHNDSYLSDKENFKTRIKLQLIKLASHNIAVSKYVASSLSTKTTVIDNCYDDETFKIYEGEQRIYDFVFLARLVSQKGCDLLIKALKNVNQPFTLNIIGNGPEKPKLEELIQSLDLQQQIKFLGVVEGAELARMLNRHRVMVVPSLQVEGFGIVALEGMACGCKVIAADAGGLIEAVQGFGKIFKMGDQKALELLLEEELKMPNKTNGFKIDADLKKFLSAHTKEAVSKKYLHLFK